LQLTRLMQNRHMSEVDARQRIQSQPPQEAKMQAAQVVIQNEGTFEDTWKQVSEAWKRSVPAGMAEPLAAPKPVQIAPPLIPDALTVEKGKPKHTVEIATFLNRMKRSGPPMGSEHVMAAFGEKAFLLLRARDKLVGLVGWQVENLIAKVVDILLDPQISAAQALPPLLTEMETASSQLLSEIALVFVPVELARLEGVWRSLGYERKALDDLSIQAWHEAAAESVLPGTVMFFKQLRRDRILRPI
jgi:dephospho-CoA kinase